MSLDVLCVVGGAELQECTSISSSLELTCMNSILTPVHLLCAFG